MGLVLTDDRHYKAIADTIRENMAHAGMNETMLPSAMPGWINDACSVAREQGAYEESEKCAAKHFVHTFVGDGGTSASFYVPFDPDALFVFCVNPRAPYVQFSLMLSTLDRRAFGYIGGASFYGGGTNPSGNISVRNLAHTVSGVRDRCSRNNDGEVTIQGIGGTTANVLFAEGFVYAVVAVKYTDKTDKERITDFVNSLSGTGSVQLDKAKVEAAFTTEEWENLIATQPGWTFTV